MEFNVRHLRALDVLRIEGSFRRAAARLGVGQPSLSRQVARMEKALGMALVDRSVDGVTLTPAGLVVVKHAGRVITAVDDMIAELDELRGTTGGELRMAASLNPALTTEFLLEAGWQVHVTRDQDTVVKALVEAGTVDLALLVDDPVAPYRPAPGLRMAVILETPLWVATPRDHSFSGRDILRLADLAGEPWLMPSGGTLRTIIGRALRKGSAMPEVRLWGDVETLFPAVETGTGIGLASPLCGAFYGYRVDVRPLADGPAERKICVWREASVSTSLVRSLVDEHQRRHAALAPVMPQYLHWLEENPTAMPHF